MDSRIVNREIRREIWPALRLQGFQRFTSRTAWKRTDVRVFVINFQSFNSYFSLVDGCTTFSFALNLGVYIPALSNDGNMPTLDPKEYDCHFRRKLFKTVDQQNYKRKDIWYVDPTGENLLPVIADARSVLLEAGMPWFRRLDDDEEVLRILVDEDENDGLFGIGARWSPSRKLLIGRCAVAIGHEELGMRVLKEGEAEMQSIRLAMESLGRNRRHPGKNR